MCDHSQSRRSFLFSAITAGAMGQAALASPIQVIEQLQRDFAFEGWPATEFIVKVQQLASLGARCGTAAELYDPAGGESLIVPLFDLSVLSEAKFHDGLNASAPAH